MKALLKVGMTAIAAFLFSAFAYADNPALRQLQDRIASEMETLIDNTGPISEEDYEECRKLIARGIREHDKGNFEKAIEFYEKALEKNPVSGTAHYEIGYSLNSMGNQVAALEAVLRSIVLDPGLEMAYVVQANILDNLGLPDEAIAAYERILGIKPDSVYARLNLGIARFRQGDYDQAQSEFMKAREIAPEHPSPLYNLAIIARNRGETYVEEEFLNEFVRVGENDRRLPEVRKRLEELTRVSIQINMPEGDDSMASANAVIGITEGGARANWRKEQHRKTFPDAKGYFQSFEEELDVLETVLAIWGSLKGDDPSLAHPVYDFAEAAQEAGYLDAYVWCSNRRKLGRKAEDWIEANSARVKTFVEWAEEAGFSEQAAAMTPPAESPGKPSVGIRDLPAIAYKAADESEFVYEIGGESASKDLEKFRKEEGKRFRELFKDEANACVGEKDAREALEAMADLVAPNPYHKVIRVFYPGDREWESAIRMCTRMGRSYRDLAPPEAAAGHIEKKKDKIFIGTADIRWFPYYLAKALWRYEPGFRQRFGGAAEDQASMREEWFALATLIGAHRNLKESEGGKPDPYMETVDAVYEGGALDGFLLMEILHKTYGVSLACLPAALEEELRGYFFNFALQRMKGEDLAGELPQ
ncbi:MAG: tetratricopeptide repeat protein [Acidobacteria bacterium]|nr:tetratricopeptide repeat protein [Acidobacteriota bacterium]